MNAYISLNRLDDAGLQDTQPIALFTLANCPSGFFLQDSVVALQEGRNIPQLVQLWMVQIMTQWQRAAAEAQAALP